MKLNSLLSGMESLWPWPGAIAWLICLLALMPAIVRLLVGKGRYLDPIWGIVFLLAVNRLTFLFSISRPLSHLTALILALVMAYFARWYQRHDA